MTVSAQAAVPPLEVLAELDADVDWEALLLSAELAPTAPDDDVAGAELDVPAD